MASVPGSQRPGITIPAVTIEPDFMNLRRETPGEENIWICHHFRIQSYNAIVGTRTTPNRTLLLFPFKGHDTAPGWRSKRCSYPRRSSSR